MKQIGNLFDKAVGKGLVFIFKDVMLSLRNLDHIHYITLFWFVTKAVQREKVILGLFGFFFPFFCCLQLTFTQTSGFELFDHNWSNVQLNSLLFPLQVLLEMK